MTTCKATCSCTNVCADTGKKLESSSPQPTQRLAKVPPGGTFFADSTPVPQPIIDAWQRTPYGPYPGYAEEGGA
ncbi:MAG: hypothetical protein WAX89_04460 [Alphaproteobacteria bacterium]